MKQVINSPIGNMLLTWSQDGLHKLHFTNKKRSSSHPEESSHQAVEQIEEYFAGRRKTFDLTLNPDGTPFQKKVWKKLNTLNYGETCNYQEIAVQLGDVKSIRAVAAAIAKNPLLLVIPCHRVVGKNGALTGFSGEVWRKKYLLEHEQNSYQTKLF